MKNFKSLNEVYDYLNSEGLGRLSSFLSEAITQETKDLCGVNNDSEDSNRKDAENHFLEEINHFLNKGDFDTIDPRLIINYRRRPKSWAVAAMIGESNAKKKTNKQD